MKAKTSTRVIKDITAIVDNTIERVFDFIVAEDVIIRFLKGKPALSFITAMKRPRIKTFGLPDKPLYK